jgi:ABC-type transporter Mla subunit MlaD
MGMMEAFKRAIGGHQPTIVDYQAWGALKDNHNDSANPDVLSRVGPAIPETNNYKLQQSYDSLLETVQELRGLLDGQVKRQEELLHRLAAMPHAVEALPQTSRMQSEMLNVITDRLSIHAQQQKKINEAISGITVAKDPSECMRRLREQIETGNEIDRQLVESFNRFSMMIDRLQAANNHAVDCLQQVRDSYASSAMQVQEWIEKSRTRNTWMVNGAFVMALVSLMTLLLLLAYHK